MLKRFLQTIAIVMLLIPSSAFAVLTPTIYSGTSGSQVMELQTILQERGYFKTKPTGYYGMLTVKAVKDFQIDNGITATGKVVGPATIALLNNSSRLSVDAKATGTATLTLTSSRLFVSPGENVTLSWVSEGMSTCKPSWQGTAVATSGVYITQPITSTTTFTIVCAVVSQVKIMPAGSVRSLTRSVTIGVTTQAPNAQAPTNSSLPLITGTPSIGQKLTASTGSWTNTPISYAYTWKRNGIAIPSAVSPTYTVTTNDSATSIAVTVVASNLAGSGEATSNSVTILGTTTTDGLWSNPATWGGTIPVAGQDITIPAGKTVILDQDTPNLGFLTIQGTMRFADKDVKLTTKGISISQTGALEIGKANMPYTKKAIITLTGTNTGGPLDRGIMIDGGRFELYGTAPSPTWTKLNNTVAAGGSSLTLLSSTNWKTGDRIAIASTDLANSLLPVSQQVTEPTEVRTIASANNTTVTVSQGLTRSHFGKLQYVTNQGLSYAQGALTKTNADTMDILDERAEVANLTRNIVIQGADDAAWANSGFGANVMVMGLSSQVRVDGVEFNRVGQAGIVGRYPMHWHLLSYDQATGNLLGDPVNNYIKNSAISNSAHRCIVIHATNAITVANNICYNISGHAIFIEDGAERRNIIENNVTMKVRSIPDNLATQVHERARSCADGATGYWITNPDNTVRNNVASDSSGPGFWLSYGVKPIKQSKLVPISPFNLDHGVFSGNVAHSNGGAGIFLECGLVDDLGNVSNIMYRPTNVFNSIGITSYKNNGGYFNRVHNPNYDKWVVADNVGGGFVGSVMIGDIKNTLVVGESLNNAIPIPANIYPGPQFGVTSYHSTVNNLNNIFVNLPNLGDPNNRNLDGVNSGAMGSNDYYFRPVEKGFKRNIGNIFINSDPGLRVLPPNLLPDYATSKNNYTLAGALWDPYGYWGPAGNYLAFDTPFLKTDSCQTLLSKNPVGKVNGLTCANSYYGVNDIAINEGLPNAILPFGNNEKMIVERSNKNGISLGTWTVENGYISNKLGNMRHFAAIKDNRYVVRFPEYPYNSSTKEFPKRLSMTFTNMIEQGDSFVLGLTYNGSTTPNEIFVTSKGSNYNTFTGSNPDSKMLTPASSLSAVENGNGLLYWQDTQNNLLWVKIMNYNLPQINTPDPANPLLDENLYRPFYLVVR